MVWHTTKRGFGRNPEKNWSIQLIGKEKCHSRRAKYGKVARNGGNK